MSTTASTIAGSGSRRGRAYLRLVFTLAVTALAVWFLWRIFSEVGLLHVRDRILAADPALFVLATAITVARFWLLALRWEILVRREAPVGMRQITPVLMAGNFVSLVMPALRVAGPILRAYYLSRETGRPRARFYGTIVADQASNFTAYAVATALAAAVVTLPGRSGIGAAGGAVMLAALVAGLTVAWMLLRDVHRGGASRIGRMLRAVAGEGSGDGWRRRLIGWWEDLVRALSGSVIGSGAWWPSLALSAVIFLAVVAVQMIAFVAIGSDVAFVQAVFAVAGAGFIQVMAASPGGTVVTEASLIGVFKAMGVDPEAAVVAVLLARFVNYLVLLPWGGVAFLRLQRRYGMPRETGGAVPA